MKRPLHGKIHVFLYMLLLTNCVCDAVVPAGFENCRGLTFSGRKISCKLGAGEQAVGHEVHVVRFPLDYSNSLS